MKYIVVLLVCLALRAQGAEVITSPPTTNWGEWGFMEMCPSGTVVQGFQLKTEPYRGAAIDDTALNGVRLFCGHPLRPNATLTSSVGSWGNWGNTFACGLNGSIIGLQLRVEAPGLIDDETATNNARFICSNMEAPNNYIEGDGLTFGQWRGAVQCSPGYSVCGLQTQVQPDRGLLLDDTALNNVAAACCLTPSHIEVKS